MTPIVELISHLESGIVKKVFAKKVKQYTKNLWKKPYNTYYIS